MKGWLLLAASQFFHLNPLKIKSLWNGLKYACDDHYILLSGAEWTADSALLFLAFKGQFLATIWGKQSLWGHSAFSLVFNFPTLSEGRTMKSLTLRPRKANDRGIVITIFETAVYPLCQTFLWDLCSRKSDFYLPSFLLSFTGCCSSNGH